MRGDGRYFQRGTRWWIAYYANGRELRESAGRTESDARALLRTRRAEREGDRLQMPEQRRITVAEVLAAYRQNRQLAGKRIDQCSLDWLATELGHERAARLTLPVLDQLARQWIERGLALGTIKMRLDYLKAAYRRGRRLGLVQTVPDFPEIRVDNARQGFFTPEQFRALQNECDGVLRDLITFQYLTGWRTREVLGVQWSDVDRRTGAITLPAERSKNGAARVLPLVGELATLIEARWAARALCPWVFHRNGRPVRDFYAAWHAACERAGLAGRIPHDFRRSIARDQIEAGVSKRVAQLVTGHRTGAVFDRYHIVGASEQAAALARVQAFRAQGECR